MSSQNISYVLGQVAQLKRHWFLSPNSGIRIWKTIAVTLDLSKAFDTVPHQGVIEALIKAAISGSLLAWFKDYLNKRFQYVTPQGCSILGPLLFIVFFDSIFRLSLSTTSSMIGYADDVTYTVKIKDDEDVIEANKDLMKICSWITDHGL